MLGYTDLVKEIKDTARTGVLITTEAKVIDYQDMIGHSTLEELGKLANAENSEEKRAFYRIYAEAAGVIETIKFYVQQSDKMINLRYERDEAQAELEMIKKDLAETRKEYDILTNKNIDHYYEIESLKKQNEKQAAEIIQLKAKLYDLMNK